MTHEFSAERPPNLKSIWPGQYEVSSWIEYLVNIAYPLFLITTFKENGKPNANFCCWGFFAGESDSHLSIFSIGNASHTSVNIDRGSDTACRVGTMVHQHTHG